MTQMSGSTTALDQHLDYSFLLLTHMVCVDQQIHNQELKALHALAKQTNKGQRTIEEMDKIFAQDKHFISIEDVARKLPLGQQNEAMRQILALA